MSQITQLPFSDSTPSTDIETLTGDTGGAVGPDISGNIDLIGGIGIDVDGVPGSNKQTFSISDLLAGTGQTIGATTVDLITFPAGATPGTYKIEGIIASFDSVTPSGGAYRLTNGIRTTGAATVLTGTTDKTLNREATIATSDVDIIVSGNNYILRATGVAGITLNWSARLQYEFVS